MSPGGRACSRAAWGFSRMEELWARLSPLTPYGKDAKEERAVLGDRAALERLYDGTELLMAFLRGAPAGQADRLAFHLKRLPRLPFARAAGCGCGAAAQAGGLDLIEVFQVKKFLANYRAVHKLLGSEARACFGLRFGSEALAARLDLGGSDPETFFVADAYHEGLRELRAAIGRADEAMRRERAAAKAASRLERGLDFGERDFLVVPKDRAAALLEPSQAGAAASGAAAAPRYAIEAYDGGSCLVRLQDGPAALALAEERAALAARERELESEVLAGLSREILAESVPLLDYADALRELDLARARALLALELGCARPELDSPRLVVEGGRFWPCMRDCERLGLAYSPLDASLEAGCAVLFGSNMGGKTVALQSLLFFQAAAQAGLFVPAKRYATSVYESLGYVGELAAAEPPSAGTAAATATDESGGPRRPSRDGLSGFGFEIREFAEAWDAARAGSAFLVFDEFARTTSSAEAEDILSAAIEALAATPGARCVFSTHFRGIDRVAGVGYFRMMGLDREAAAAAMLSGEPLAERIRMINRMMRYRIVEAEAEEEQSDAVAIASLLGIDPSIAARASERCRARARRGDNRGGTTT